MHLYTLVRYLLDCLQERTVLLLAPILPKELAPEVKNISKQIDCSRILLHGSEHGDKGLLMGIEIRNSPRTQMCIGEKVDHILDRFAVVCSSLVLLAVDRCAVRLEESEF